MPLEKAETAYEVIQRYWEFDWTTFNNKILKNNPVLSEKQQVKFLEGSTTLSIGFFSGRAKPQTGRTHQIRVHFASMQHPLLADKIYSGKKAPSSR